MNRLIYILYFTILGISQGNTPKIDNELNWRHVDYIEISLRPFTLSVVAASPCTPNDIRAWSEYKIIIKSTHSIRELVMRFNKLELKKAKAQKYFYGCRLVIDFYTGARIIKSITINSHSYYIIDEPVYNEIQIYEPDSNFLCYINDLIPKFMSLSEKKCD